MPIGPSDGVLLDMDGTLLDTETIYHSSTVAVLESLGYPGAVDTCQAMIGVPGRQCEEMLLSRYGAAFPVTEFTRSFSESSDRLFAKGIPLKAGAVELLEALAVAQCPRAIVTLVFAAHRRQASRTGRHSRPF